jgi:hypothetical protein
VGEISDLVGIYGAIDRAIADDPDLRDRVASRLPIYHDSDVRWFDAFEAWTRELQVKHAGAESQELPDPPFPSLEDALRELGEIPAEGRMRARRLMAIALAGQAFPPIRDPNTESDLRPLAQNALRGPGLIETEDSQQLLDLLTDDSLLPPTEGMLPDADAWWDNLLATAFEQNLVPEPAELGPRPCTGTLVTVPGADGPAAALETYFETDKIEFDRAVGFLAPANWPGCCSFWCEMTERGEDPPGRHRFHEVVSTDCAHPSLGWTVSAELDFAFTLIPGVAAITQYGLSAGHPRPADDVQVDEGSLVVRQIGTGAAPRISVRTTKRVRFSSPFSGEQLALIMCALGYANVVEHLVFTCALSGAEPTAPFSDPSSRKSSTTAGPQPVIEDLADHVATSIKACIDDCAQAVRASCDKIDAGSYNADALVQDIAGIWVRTVREGAKAFDLGVRSARAAGARPGKPPPS